jgi:hypothetical protein
VPDERVPDEPATDVEATEAEADVNELDEYAAFGPDPEPAAEVEPSANGHHDRVEDSPYDRSLHQS